MQRQNDRLLFSPSDLGGFMACEHLTQLDLAVALRQGRRPSYENAYAELLRAKGQEHEQAFLTTLRDDGRRVVEVRLDAARDFEAGTRRTAEAMRAGADYVYQAVFLSQGWRGIADFLERVERPSALGAGATRSWTRSWRGIPARSTRCSSPSIARRSGRSSSWRPIWPTSSSAPASGSRSGSPT
jgi:hypothetical protein